MFGKYRPVKALWPELHIKDKKFLPLWAALLIALSLEFSPFFGQYLYGLLGLEAIFEEEFEELPEIKMTVNLNQRPVLEVPPQSQPEEEEEEEVVEPDLEEIKNTIPLVEQIGRASCRERV